MRKALGTLIILAGIGIAVWLGVVVFFIGGIEQIIAGFNVTPHNGSEIGWGFAKVLGADTISTIVGVVIVSTGMAVYSNGQRSRRFRHHKQARWTGLR